MEFDPADPRNQIYARPPEYWKIFISSKMAGDALKAQRAAAIKAVNAFPLTKAWAWELSASAGPYYSEHECVAQAGTSDGLVLILDYELTDVTLKEFEAARSAHAPVFLMLKTGVKRNAALQRFIKRTRQFAVTVNFSSTGELRTQITDSLRTWALRSGRSSILRAHEASAVSTRDAAAKADDDFHDFEVSFGTEKSPVPVTNLVADAERLVGDGDPEQALSDLWELAQGASDVGLGWLGMKLLDEIDRIIPGEAINDRWRGWLCNTRGLVLSAGSRHAEARTEFDRMRQIGRALDDADLESTALQNLGVQDLLADNPKNARAKLVRSFEMKRAIGDWRGGLQVLFNLVNVFVGQGNLEAAEALLEDLEAIMTGLRDPMLRSTLHGLRGSVAVARKEFSKAQGHFRDALRAARRAQSTPRIITSMQNLGSTAATTMPRKWPSASLRNQLT